MDRPGKNSAQLLQVKQAHHHYRSGGNGTPPCVSKDHPAGR